MQKKGVSFSVFTKMWKDKSPTELGEFVLDLGFDGIELPVRADYPVPPESVGRDLPKAAKELGALGVAITSVAGPTDEATIAACGAAGVPVIRTCPAIATGGYLASVEGHQRAFDALIPLLDKHGVALGIQNHEGQWVCNAMGIKHLIDRYDPSHICAIPCAGHTALNGESPEMAIDIVWSHLSQFKAQECVLAAADRSGSGKRGMASLLDHGTAGPGFVAAVGGGTETKGLQRCRLHGCRIPRCSLHRATPRRRPNLRQISVLSGPRQAAPSRKELPAHAHNRCPGHSALLTHARTHRDGILRGGAQDFQKRRRSGARPHRQGRQRLGPCTRCRSGRTDHQWRYPSGNYRSRPRANRRSASMY